MFGQKKENQKSDLEIFVFYDSKAQAYGNPTFAINQHDLIRQITNMFNEPEQQQKNTLFLNAEDFSVFRIGSYEKSTGKITVDQHQHIANLHDLRTMVTIKDVRHQIPEGNYPRSAPGSL